MKIRKATEKDLKEITKIFVEEFGKPPYNEQWKEKTALTKIKHYFKTGKIFVVEEKEVIGFMIIHDELWPDGKTCSIDEFVIKKEFQGKGIGTKFLKEIENKLKKEKYKEVRLWTSSDAKAFEFYRKRKYSYSTKAVLFRKWLK